MRNLGLSILFILAYHSTARAHDMQLLATFYTDSCEYFSGQRGVFTLNFQPVGKTPVRAVEIVYGWGNPDRSLSWQESQTRSLKKTGNIWTVTFDKTLVGRGGPVYRSLQFIIHILYENGQQGWLDGMNGVNGYLETTEPFPQSSIPCSPPGMKPVPTKPFPVSSLMLDIA